MSVRRRTNRFAWIATIVAGCAWLASVAAWMTAALPPTVDLDVIGLPDRFLPIERTFTVVFAAAVVVSGLWMLASWRRGQRTRLAVASLALLPCWQLGVYAGERLGWPAFRAAWSTAGLAAAFFVGFAWVIWYSEGRWQQYRAAQRVAAQPRPAGRVWNPFHPDAWYYGRHRQKLNQSITLLAGYALVFFSASLLNALIHFGQGRESYEMPGGGGGSGQGAQAVVVSRAVRVQKVVKKKFVINPFSAIIFTPPPIDDVKLQIEHVADHLYSVGAGQGGAGSGRGTGIGYGDGEGSGFGGGTGMGKVRFIRLEYAGGDWNQDFGIGADLNMLIEYHVRTTHPVADQTESRTIGQLAAFPIGKSPPLVYLTGQKNITLSKAEIKTLREYLLDKHGMLFGDNGGSQQFHNQFFAMMREVLPNVEPVRVPLDDVIHRVPYPLPFLPYVAPHGGKEAWGWKMDGRWVCYYHPGDIGDAWTDDHSGVKPAIWQACYQLGTNIIFYAHVEYSKWLQARNKN